MNPNEPQLRLHDWFDAVEPRSAPNQILENVFAVTRRTRQRRGLVGQVKEALAPAAPLDRGERMNRMLVTVGGIAAAIIVAVGLAYSDWGVGPDIGGHAPTSRPKPGPSSLSTPGVTAVPSSTTSPSPTATAVPTPIATTWPTATALPTSGLLEPARYFVEVDGYRYMFSVPESGWESEVRRGETYLRKENVQDSGELGLLLLAGEVGPSEVVHADPCDPGATVDAGETAEDFASALDRVQFYDALKPTDVTFSRYQGKRVRIFASGFTSCIHPDLYPNFDGIYRTWDGRDHIPDDTPQVRFLNYDIRIVDLDRTRHLFYTTHFAGPESGELQSVLSQIVDSMEIETATR